VHWHRPVDRIEIVMNGKVVAETSGAGPLTFRVPLRESSWIAARAAAARMEDEPEILAHTNPVYCLRDERPVALIEAREAVRKQWATQAAYYRNPELPMTEAQRRELLRKVEETEARLR
jgi:dihydrodipicolinate synthase/N-acetylneuraminate lyase